MDINSIMAEGLKDSKPAIKPTTQAQGEERVIPSNRMDTHYAKINRSEEEKSEAKNEKSKSNSVKENPESTDGQQEVPKQKNWWESRSEKEVLAAEETHKSVTKKFQEAAELKRLYEAKMAEKETQTAKIETAPEGDVDFDAMDITEQISYLKKELKNARSGKDIESIKKELIGEFEARQVAREAGQKLVSEIKSFVKDSESTDISDKDLMALNDNYHAIHGHHISNFEQFKYHWNAVKGEFSNKLIDKAKEEGFNESQKEIKERKERVAANAVGTSKKSEKSKSKDGVFKTNEERFKAMMNDPDLDE